MAIVGSHPRTRAEFDFARDDCDIWLFNEALSNKANEWAKRASAVFQMHEEAIWRNPANRNDPKHYEWLTTQTDVDIYMQDQYADVPKSIRFPLEEIVSTFKIQYFTSSVAYAIALACFLGYKRIELYGVEMETNTEYVYQRDGVTLWIGVALGRGIEVDAHIAMFDQPLYGYEGEVTFKYEQLAQRIDELKPLVEQAGKEYHASVVNVQQALRAFTSDASAANEANLFGTVGRQRELSEKLGKLDGAMQENQKYKKKADVMRQASGGEFLFSRQEFESSAKALSDETNRTNIEFISAGTALDIIHSNLKRCAKNSPKQKKLVATYEKQLQVYLALANKVAVYNGAASENYRIMTWLDKHIRAAGGSKSEAALLESMVRAESDEQTKSPPEPQVVLEDNSKFAQGLALGLVLGN